MQAGKSKSHHMKFDTIWSCLTYPYQLHCVTEEEKTLEVSEHIFLVEKCNEP